MSGESTKKRKTKVIRSDSGAAVGAEKEAKKLRGDGEQETKTYTEEGEVETRDPAKDYDLYKKTCDDLQRLMAEIHELKSKGAKDTSAEIDERRIQSCIHFMTLKKLNRLAHIRLKKGRDQTHEAKQKVDALHLQLQNLLYEVMHLQKEITKCLEFKSKHEEIDLVNVEEFYQCAPLEISKPTFTTNDPHQQTLARLDWELEQRKRLAEQYKESLTSKEKILKDIDIKKEYLSSLQPRLTNIMQASLPVQEYLSMPYDQAHKQYEVARHLPPPLYVLYVQANAYRQACAQMNKTSQPYGRDKNLVVAIEGDVEEAKALARPPDDSQEDESDSEAEEEQATTKRRRPTLGLQLDDKRREMLKRHPLSVTLDLKYKDGSMLHLYFYYLMKLNIMTVKTKVTTATEMCTAISAGDLLSPASLLSCLYPGDHVLFGVCYSPLLVQIIIIKHSPLPFPLPEQELVTADNSVSASHMETTVKLLRVRLQSRLSLQKQFASLEHSIVPVCSECQHLFPTKILSRLIRWSAITYEDYAALPYTKHVIDADMAQETDLFFSALIERGTAKLHVAIGVNPGYSTVPPIFSICLNWKGEKTSRNDDNLKAIESEVNVYFRELLDPKPGHQLLTNQIQRLCMCLDVYLETETHDNSVEGPMEFPREKMCMRLVRGPNRIKPFKYNHPQGFFTHR
uniref:THO complex 5 n=1 Tax=Callorhinchus milii TaxID=7868 RepID=A0A4W3HN92_CALMI